MIGTLNASVDLSGHDALYYLVILIHPAKAVYPCEPTRPHQPISHVLLLQLQFCGAQIASRCVI